MIHVCHELVAKTLEIIKESYDCADVLNDLNRINQAIENINLFGYWPAADQLDRELRQKYPCIDKMLSFANSISVPVPRTPKTYSENETILKLNQDFYGIICDTAINKQLVCSLKDCIKAAD